MPKIKIFKIKNTGHYYILKTRKKNIINKYIFN